MSNIQLSVVILTRNEENNIAGCIESVKWCDEVVVIDDNSTDQTAKIAKALGAKVYEKTLENDFAAQRNFGLEQTQGQWVLFLDADERVSEQLAFEIQNRLIVSGYTQAYLCRRLDTMWGRLLRYGEVGNIRLIRLAKKDAGKWVGAVHETWKIKGRVSELTHPLLHFPHPTLTDFLQELNSYTSLRAQELYDKKIRVRTLDIIAYPKAKFFVNYIFRLGFLDGIPGLLIALLMSFHSFLVRGKLWILWHKK